MRSSGPRQLTLGPSLGLEWLCLVKKASLCRKVKGDKCLPIGSRGRTRALRGRTGLTAPALAPLQGPLAAPRVGTTPAAQAGSHWPSFPLLYRRPPTGSLVLPWQTPRASRCLICNWERAQQMETFLGNLIGSKT